MKGKEHYASYSTVKPRALALILSTIFDDCESLFLTAELVVPQRPSRLRNLLEMNSYYTEFILDTLTGFIRNLFYGRNFNSLSIVK